MVRTTSSTPSFWTALIGMTGTPSSSLILRTSIVPPLLRTSSIMLSAMTIGMRRHSSCRLR